VQPDHFVATADAGLVTSDRATGAVEHHHIRVVDPPAAREGRHRPADRAQPLDAGVDTVVTTPELTCTGVVPGGKPARAAPDPATTEPATANGTHNAIIRRFTSPP
jgi:hypothetical protein